MNRVYVAETPQKECGKTHTIPVQSSVTAENGGNAVVPQVIQSSIGRDVNTNVYNLCTGHNRKHCPNASEQFTSQLKEDLSLYEQFGALSLCSSPFKIPETDLHEAQKKNKCNLKKKCQTIFEGITRPGKSVSLHCVYTNLCITEGDSVGVNDEHEVLQNKATSERETSQETSIHLNDIFRPLPGQEKSIRTVLTKGIAGIGKTISVQKFILNWLEDQVNEDVLFIFLFSFRELNTITQNELSLRELLHSFYPETDDLTVENYKVLFIFDGLDEYQYPLKFLSRRCVSLTEIAPLDVLLSNLIEGNLLPSALLWITSRPAAASDIPPEFIDQVTEIRGFNDHQKEEYFRKKFPDQDLASRILSHVKSSRSLHIMCHIPIFCWISAAVLGQMLTKDDREIPSTLTQMYSRFLLIQINLMNKKYHGDTERNVTKLSHRDKEIIMKLAELAFQHLEKRNVMFRKEDLEACGIEDLNASVYSVLCTEMFKEEIALIPEKFYCFVHLTIQEYLAALHACHLFATKQMDSLNKIFKTKPRAIHGFHKAAVDKALEYKNGQFDLFLRFLLGMSLDINQYLLKDLLPSIRSNSEGIKKTTKYIVKVLKKKDLSPERCINLIHCLVELNDRSLLEEIQMSGSSSSAKLTVTQCTALAYMLIMPGEVCDMFDLKKCKVSEEGLKRLLPVIKCSKKACLDRCGLSADCCETVSFALQSANSHLTELNLSHNDLGDLGLEKLCVGLKSPNCKLESLDLSFNKLNASGMKQLSDVLIGPHCKLRSLDLSNNDLEDSGVNVLCQALSNHQCKLKTLRLYNCRVTEGGCTSLASALRLNPSYLNELDMYNNHPGDHGVKLLTAIQKNNNFKLEKLNIDHVGQQRVELQKYACQLTLDEKTANKYLSITKIKRKVTRKQRSQAYTDLPERFNRCYQVLCREGLSGRCYWEAEWSGCTAYIGVAYRGICRNGAFDAMRLGDNDKSWSLFCSNKKFSAHHNKTSSDIPIPQYRSCRIGVYLDWAAGTLSFYSVSSDTLTHLYTFHSTFSEPLYPAFRLLTSETSWFLCPLE